MMILKKIPVKKKYILSVPDYYNIMYKVGFKGYNAFKIKKIPLFKKYYR